MIDLSGRTALVTGASRGIGEATARALAAAGARVALTARDEAAIQAIAADIGDAALAVRCDVTKAGDVQAAVQATMAHFGALDIVVNNAGTIEPVARLEDSDPERWGAVVDVNLKGVYHVMQAAFGSLKAAGEAGDGAGDGAGGGAGGGAGCKAGGAVIINLSSGAAINALEGWSHYCATKAGVAALTRCGHKEWSQHGIRVVGLSPGTVATEMQNVIRESGVNAVSKLDWSAHITPDEAATAILYLCTDAARQHDGGDFSIKTAEGRREAGLSARP